FQRRVLYCRLLAPTPLSPNPAGSQRAAIFQLSQTLPNHWAREASYSRNCRNSASADRLALRSCHQTSRPLIQNRAQCLIARLDPRRIDHCVKYTSKTFLYGNVIYKRILSVVVGYHSCNFSRRRQFHELTRTSSGLVGVVEHDA